MSVQNQKPSWVAHFKIDETTWDTLLKDSFGAGCLPLALACEKNLINESEFLLHEQVNSELPVLSAAFFDTEPPNGIFNSFDFKDFKKEGLLPLSSWEGHTLFAKTSSEVTEFQKQLAGAIFVLAPWTAMKKWFSLWEKQQGVQDSPQGLKITTPPSQTLSSINFGEIKLENITPQPRPVDPDTSSYTSMIQIAPTAPTPPPPIPVPQTKIQPYPTIALPDLNQAMGVKPPPIPGSTTQKMTLAPIPFDQIMGRTKMASTLEDLYVVILGCWKNYFDCTMLFEFSPTDNKLSSIKWEGNWKISDAQKAIIIPTTAASIFKVALDTGHPYHGYVVSNPINKAFFDETNGGEIPAHATITCINQNERPSLVIFGACSKDASLSFNINQLESLTDTFAQQFQKLNSDIKQAS